MKTPWYHLNSQSITRPVHLHPDNGGEPVPPTENLRSAEQLLGDVQPDYSVELAPTAPSLYVQIRLLVQSLLTLSADICPRLKVCSILNQTLLFVNSFLC